MKIVCFFIPAILAVAVYDNVFKKKLKLKEIVYNYALFNMLINIITNIFIMITKSGSEILNDDRFTSRFTTKYLIITFLLSFILPIIVGFIRETFKYEISIEHVKVNKDEK